MDELVEFIARNLASVPEAVRVERVQRNDLRIYKLNVDPVDMGRIIGRRGSVATAIRSVMQAAPIGADRRLALDIQEGF